MQDLYNVSGFGPVLDSVQNENKKDLQCKTFIVLPDLDSFWTRSKTKAKKIHFKKADAPGHEPN